MNQRIDNAIVIGNETVGGTLSVTGHTTFEGVTSTGATGTGNLVYSASPTFSGTVTAGNDDNTALNLSTLSRTWIDFKRTNDTSFSGGIRWKNNAGTSLFTLGQTGSSTNTINLYGSADAIIASFHTTDLTTTLAGTLTGTSLSMSGAGTFGGVLKEVVAEYADNAAAVGAGLAVGTHYRTVDVLKIVH